MAEKNVGKIIQIIGAVLDIKFSTENMPALFNAIEIEHEGRTIVAEVAQHLGDDVVKCIAMSSTDGLVRGMDAVDTGAPISVPVGQATLGRMFNVVGQPIDDNPAPEAKEKWSIHRSAPSFAEQAATTELLETGIKSIDLLCPYSKGGKIGLFGGAGVGKQFLLWNLSVILLLNMVVSLFSLVLVKEQEKVMTFIMKCKNLALLTKQVLFSDR